MATMQSFSSTGMYQAHHPSIPSSHKAPTAPTTFSTPANTNDTNKSKIRNGMTENQIIVKLMQSSYDEIMDLIAWQLDKNPNNKNFGGQEEQEKQARLPVQQEQQNHMDTFTPPALLETSKKTSSSARTFAMPQQQEYMQSDFRPAAHEDREGAESEVSLAGTGTAHTGPGYKSFISNTHMKSPLVDDSASITLRLLTTSPSSPTFPNAHDIFELSPTLSYSQLIPRIRTFLLNISHAAARHQNQNHAQNQNQNQNRWDSNHTATSTAYNPKQNLPIAFTSSSTIKSIKIIWAGLTSLPFPVPTTNQVWDRDFGVAPGSDVVVTRENWGGIVKALKKRDGSMDVVLVEVEGVGEERKEGGFGGGYEDAEAAEY